MNKLMNIYYCVTNDNHVSTLMNYTITKNLKYMCLINALQLERIEFLRSNLIKL